MAQQQTGKVLVSLSVISSFGLTRPPGVSLGPKFLWVFIISFQDGFLVWTFRNPFLLSQNSVVYVLMLRSMFPRQNRLGKPHIVDLRVELFRSQKFLVWEKSHILGLRGHPEKPISDT